MGRRRLRGWLSATLALATVAGACTVTKTRGINTDRLLTEFNGGAVDSFPDPDLCSDDIAIERVAITAKRSLVRGYASQGTPTGPTAAAWMSDHEVRKLVRQLVQSRRRQRNVSPRLRQACEAPPSTTPIAALPCTGRPTSPILKETANADDELAGCFRRELFQVLHDRVAPPIRLGEGAFCVGQSPTPAASHHADAGRLSAGLELAAIDVAQLIDEEVVTLDQAVRGLDRALDEAAAYLTARRWKPSVDSPTLGLSVKGGASSGVYSAGVTWRVLTMLERYREWRRRNPSHSGIPAEAARFDLAAGTSAGAIIAATVDLFHQDACVIDPAAETFRDDHRLPDGPDYLGGRLPVTGPICQDYARRVLATVFTCVDQGTMYCVDSRPIWEVAGDQKGLMEFDGLRKLIARYIGPLAPANTMELVLTTVDFRWGELYVQTDQDPSTVVQPRRGMIQTPYVPEHADPTLSQLHASIEASFVLPFIAWPVEELRIAGKDRDGIYLDGGIKSEIPIISLAQRGAQKTLVVGSAPPRITPTKPQSSALEIAARYLDVSLSAVTESEWNAVVPVADYIETFERAACAELLDVDTTGGPVAAGAFCGGDLAAACGAPPRGRGFDRLGIFRREDIDPSIGYTFDPVQMRRLFDAGAAAARANCRELATFLGLGNVPAAELDLWCNETPRTEQGLCEDAKEDYRTCDFEPEDERAKQP